MGCGTSGKKATDPKPAEEGLSKSHTIMKRTTNFVDSYALGDRLGSGTADKFTYLGTYAEVWSATHKASKQKRAVKIVKKSLAKTYSKLYDMLASEFETLTKLVCNCHLFFRIAQT